MISWLSEPVGLVFMGTRGPQEMENSCWPVITPRALYWEQTDTPSASLRKRPMWFSWSFGLRRKLLVWHTCRSYWGTLQGQRPGVQTLSFTSTLHLITSIFQKRACALICHADFCGCCPGDAPWLPSSGGQWGLNLQVLQDYQKWTNNSHWLYFIHDKKFQPSGYRRNVPHHNKDHVWQAHS